MADMRAPCVRLTGGSVLLARKCVVQGRSSLVEQSAPCHPAGSEVWWVGLRVGRVVMVLVCVMVVVVMVVVFLVLESGVSWAGV